jgi:hypothetical protein
MSGGINESQQFVGLSVRKPYEDSYGPILQKYDHTEEGIEEAHGHADMLAAKMNIPRQVIRVAAYGSNTQMVGDVDRPVKKVAPRKAKSAPTVKAAKVTKPVQTKTTKAPALDEVTVTKGGKSATYKLGK